MISTGSGGSRERSRHRERAVPARAPVLGWAVAAVLTAACGGGDGDGAPVTVTETRPAEVSATPPPTGTAPGTPVPSSSAPPSALPLIADRSFDAALLASSRRQGADLVLVIDRLTVAGVDDATLAAQGVPVQPDPGDRFGNQREALYEVGVAPGAVFVLTSCTRSADGSATQDSRPLTADEFAGSVPRDAPVLLAYTSGLVSRAEVNPRC